MLINADTVERDSELEGDVIIIGSGAAGIPLALKLSKKETRIIILESGEEFSNASHQALNELRTTELSVDTKSRARTLGGTTTLWSGKWKPHDDIDIEGRPWIPHSSWPLSSRELWRYYNEASDVLGMPLLSKHTPEGIISSEKLKTHLIRHVPNGYLDFGKRFKKELSHKTNIQVYLGASVTKIIKAENLISHVSVKTLSGNRFRVRGRVFVLACGGIENARLLLVSNVGNEYDQVGRYYMDHPKGVLGEIAPKNRKLEISLDIGFGLSDSIQKNFKALNSYVLFYPIYRRVELTNNLPKPLGWIIYKILRLFLGKPKLISHIVIRNYMEQAPHPDNRITLGKDTDAFGTPLPVIHWQITKADKETMYLLHRELRDSLHNQGLGIMTSPLLEGVPLTKWPISQDASHHMGTTRMGEDERNSVVDRDCKVHGIENLYIAGSSVFPTGGASSPTTTIVALTLRLADHIGTKYLALPLPSHQEK